MNKTKNGREGRAYLVKLIMVTKNGEINKYVFMKVESFVNFNSEESESIAQLNRQIVRRVSFYENLYQIKVIKHSYTLLYAKKIQFFPKPFSFKPHYKRRKNEQAM